MEGKLAKARAQLITAVLSIVDAGAKQVVLEGLLSMPTTPDWELELEDETELDELDELEVAAELVAGVLEFTGGEELEPPPPQAAKHRHKQIISNP